MEALNYADRVLWNNPLSIERKLFTQIKQLKDQIFDLSNIINEESSNKEDNETLLTTKEACKILGRSKETLWRYRKAKILPFIRVASVGIRFRKEDVYNLLKQN